MLLHKENIEKLISFLTPHLNDLLMDYREGLTGGEADYFVKRIAEFLQKKKWVTEKHFFETCRYLVENSITFRKLSVASFKTAFSKLYDK